MEWGFSDTPGIKPTERLADFLVRGVVFALVSNCPLAIGLLASFMGFTVVWKMRALV